MPLPSCTSHLDAHSGQEEEQLSFCAFDVTTWVRHVWNEGVSGVVVDLRSAYNYWQQTEHQVQLPFDCLVAWIGALEAGRDLTDRFMDLDWILLQKFRMQLMMASDSGIRLSKLRARLYTAVYEADILRGQPSLSRNGEGRDDRCDFHRVAFTGTTHLHAAFEVHLEEFTRSTDGRQKKAKGLPAAHEDGRR
ncbi:helicase-like protein [Trypanosoma cruzi]|nr:helicase-like protein [Trypanosoma cruzi]